MAQNPAKSDIPTTSPDAKAFAKNLGGQPPEKSFDEIVKANSPSGRKPAPNSFRPSK